VRRAEDLRKAATTAREAGFDPWMSAATAEKQAWVATLARVRRFRGQSARPAWRDYAGKIIASAQDRSTVAPKRSSPPDAAASYY